MTLYGAKLLCVYLEIYKAIMLLDHSTSNILRMLSLGKVSLFVSYALQLRSKIEFCKTIFMSILFYAKNVVTGYVWHAYAIKY